MPADAGMWLAANCSVPEGVMAGCSTVYGGVSTGAWQSLNLAQHVGDDASHVEHNRQRLQTHLGIGSMQWLNQTHSVRCVPANPQVTPDADAVWTDVPGIGLNVLTADCVPVLLWRTSGDVVAAVHAGWRGLVDGVIAQTLAQLPGQLADYCAWIGPCICAQHYEVGEDVWRHFETTDDVLTTHADAAKRYLDLPQAAKIQLTELGLQRCYLSGWCSFGDARFYSHRGRTAAQTGRMTSLIAIRGS